MEARQYVPKDTPGIKPTEESYPYLFQYYEKIKFRIKFLLFI